MYSLMVGIGILLSYTIGRDGKKIQDKLGNHGVKQQSEVQQIFLLLTLHMIVLRRSSDPKPSSEENPWMLIKDVVLAVLY